MKITENQLLNAVKQIVKEQADSPISNLKRSDFYIEKYGNTIFDPFDDRDFSVERARMHVTKDYASDVGTLLAKLKSGEMDAEEHVKASEALQDLLARVLGEISFM